MLHGYRRKLKGLVERGIAMSKERNRREAKIIRGKEVGRMRGLKEIVGLGKRGTGKDE
jgi:hypothetical protein